MKSDAQYRIAVLVAATCSFLGYAVAGRGGALTWAAFAAMVIYVSGWFASQYIRSTVAGSTSDPTRSLRRIRAVVLVLGAVGATTCLIVLLKRSEPATAVASAVFLAGAFAAGQSFALFERSDLSGSLLITTAGAIVGAAARTPLLLVIALVVTWMGAAAVALTLLHTSELATRLEHSEPAVEQEGADWWPSLFAKILPVIAVIALLIALLSPLLRFSLTKFEPDSPTFGRPPGGGSQTPGPPGSGSSGTPSPSESGTADDNSPSPEPDGDSSNGGGGGSGGGGGHAGGEPGQDVTDPEEEPGGQSSDPDRSPSDTPSPSESRGQDDSGDGGPQSSPEPTSGDGQDGDTGDGSTNDPGNASPSPASRTPRPGSGRSTKSPTPAGTQGGDFNPSLNLPSGEVLTDDTPVMRIQAPFPWYWRGVVFDTYSDGSWKAETGETERLGEGKIRAEKGAGKGGRNFEGRVSIFNSRSHAVFTAYRPDSIDVLDDDSPPAMSIRQDMVISTSKPANDITYAITAVIPDSNPEVLREQDGPAPSDFDRYLQIPASISPRVHELASEITNGKKGRYEKAVAIVEYLRRQSKTVDRVDAPPADVDPVEHYLFEGDNVGFSNHLASATAVLLRSSGIEARVVSGYVPRSPPDEAGFLVRRSDAYDWVEVYFPNSGWVTFDAGLGALRPEIATSGWQRFTQWLKRNWFWLTALAIVVLLLIAAGIRALKRRGSESTTPTEAQDLLTRLERAARYGRLAPQTPFEYARALRWKLLPDDGEVAESVLTLIAESAYSGTPMSPEQRSKAVAAVDQIRRNESRRRGEDERRP